MNLLIIIDLQNEFINENTKWIIGEIDKLRLSAQYDSVIFTRFINGVDNPTYKIGWRGCMDKKSRELCIKPRAEDRVFDKTTYSAHNKDLANYLEENHVEKMFLCGLDIDCCVLATAFDLFDAGYDVFILKDYVGCMQGNQLKTAALEILARNIGESKILVSVDT